MEQKRHLSQYIIWILLVLILIVLGALLWVILADNEDESRDNINNQTTSTQQSNEDEQTNNTDEWAVYETSSYSIQLSDGWELMRKQSDERSLVGIGNEALAPQPGTKAIVSEYDPSSDLEFTYGLVVDYLDPSQGNCTEFYGFERPAVFETKGGSPVFEKIETSTQNESLNEGDIVYSYCLNKGDDTIITTYTVKDGDEDYSSTVEEVVSSIR